jgi:hypothetical protein
MKKMLMKLKYQKFGYNSKIILKYNERIIAIELKSGKSTDASMLYQIERYLP